jgi:tetratricopeptide (TPR) repeat protein
MALIRHATCRRLAPWARKPLLPKRSEIHDHLRRRPSISKANDPAPAVKEFDAVLALDPKNAEANANLGVIAFFQRDYLNASQHLQRHWRMTPP